MKRTAPATQRNRQPILEVLRPLLAPGSLVVEVASGTGEHAAFFAAEMPDVVWQPSDREADSLASIEAHRAEAALGNLRAPVVLDVIRGGWPVARADAVVCINMIHIAPWAACEGLVRGAAGVLGAGGVLYLYGPYRIAGELPAPSNVAFDERLRAQNPAWGVRELEQVTALATAAGFVRKAVLPMPANNQSVVFQRV